MVEGFEPITDGEVRRFQEQNLVGFGDPAHGCEAADTCVYDPRCPFNYHCQMVDGEEEQ